MKYKYGKHIYGIRIYPNRKWVHNLFKCHRYTPRGQVYDSTGMLWQRYICNCGDIKFKPIKEEK